MNSQNVEYNLKHALSRLANDLKSPNEPFVKLLLALRYVAKLIDTYMKDSNNRLKKKEFYIQFELLYRQLEQRINYVTANQYLLQKQPNVEILSEIVTILNDYANLQENSQPVSLIFQTINPTLALKQVKLQFQRIKEYYASLKIIEAYSQIQKVKLKKNQSAYIKAMIKEENWANLNKIQEEFINFDKIQQIRQDKQDWVEQIDQKQAKSSLHYKVFQQEYDSQSTIAIKIQAQIQIDPIILLAIIFEPEFFSKYVPFVQESRPLDGIRDYKKKLPINARAAQCWIVVPHLAQSKYLTLYTQIYDEISTSKSFVIIARSLKIDQKFRQRYDFSRDYAEEVVNLHYCCIQVKLINRSKVYLRLFMKPHFQREYFEFQRLKLNARIFYSHYIQNLCNFAKKLKNNQWRQFKENNKEFYNLIERKLDLHFSKNT